MRKLLTNAKANPKTAKDGEGIEAVIQHLSPARIAGVGNMCQWSTKGCREACLNTSGMSQVTGELTLENMSRYSNHHARIGRTQMFMNERKKYFEQLYKELTLLEKRASRRGSLAASRLNGTSDIPWESMRYDGESMMNWFPNIQFYDYTKSLARTYTSVCPDNKGWPDNYHLTLSRSEEWSEGETEYNVKEYGVNVAVVFREMIPKLYEGVRVINGTLNDWRFMDPTNVVVGLLAKGRGKRDTTGFVVGDA